MARAASSRVVVSVCEQLERRALLDGSLVADANSIFPTDAVTIDGWSYFPADDRTHGRELWRSNGTPNGTELVKDLIVGRAGSNLFGLTQLNGRLLFFSYTSEKQLALWASDGTASGTTMLADFGVADITYVPHVVANGRLVFAVHGGRHNPHVWLWSSDGTAAGTRGLVQLYEGEDYNTVTRIVSNGRRAMFVTAGAELWSTDGTPSGTADIHGVVDGIGAFVYLTPATLTEWRGSFYFGTQVSFVSQLWKSDGTPKGSAVLGEFAGTWGHGQVWTAGGHLCFNIEEKLCRTDGTAAGTEAYAPAPPDGGRISSVATMADGGVALFTVRTSTNEPNKAPFALSLWRTDGTTAGTYSVKTLNDGTVLGRTMPSAYQFVEVGGVMFVMVTVEGSGKFVIQRRELWRTDGMAAGTALVQDYSQYVRDDLDAEMKRLSESGEGFPTLWIDEDRDTVRISAADGRLAVETPDGTDVFDPATMVAPVGPVMGYVRLDDDDGTLRVFGTRGADNIRIFRMTGDDADRFVVDLNGVRKTFRIEDVQRIRVYGYYGDDRLAVYERPGQIGIRVAFWGGNGDDTIFCGCSRDSVFGGGGDDVIRGGGGNDTLAGGTGDDTVGGDGGIDFVTGGSGEDCLDGGGGADVLFGQTVFEIFYKGKRTDDKNDLESLLLG